MNRRAFKKPLPLCALIATGFSLSLFGDEAYFSDEDFFNEEIGDESAIYDPLEPINRYVFKFNDYFYSYALEPIAKGYTKITPEPVQKGAGNFFKNLKYPVRLAGNLLQARWDGAWVETGRFAINSTVGILGVMTPADDYEGFEPIPAEGVGQAFGAWGIGEGPYLVLPGLGPSNLRDLAGFIGDLTVLPLTRPISLIDDWNWEWRLALDSTDFIVRSPSIFERYERTKGSAIDPYSAVKNGYTQYRRAAVAE